MNRLFLPFATISLALACVQVTGCMSAADHAAALHSSRDRDLTVGLVQKDIRYGMSQSDVAASLGSPNIVTREDNGNEASRSSDSGGWTILLAGSNKQAGASATTQRTLTVVIKFDHERRVSNFTYHSTKF
jgi:hypothetical protein